MAAAAAAALPASAAPANPPVAIANPAAVFCVESGGRDVIMRDAGGNAFGACILPGGEMVEEWTYYRGHHPAPGR
ncbi:MAG TPA: DUF333 domain-containing protein [Stellaceae bacterium]|nr:DUF333 domain-containing protein [Stellaceae bacterium]